MEYEIGSANHLGNRNSNQDRFAVVETQEGILLALADGMGGHAGGEIAAQMLVDIARASYLNVMRPLAQPGRFLAEIIRQTHDRLLKLAAERNLSDIPGTTGVLCLIQRGQMEWVHVGDSRLYLFRDGVPVFRTIDHSYVEQLYKQGVISRAEQDSHPRRNHLTQCIGCLPQQPEADIGRGKPLREGDIILLCSDGLWSALDDAQLGALLEGPTLDDILERMAQRAEQNSYPHSDNISVVAIRLISLLERVQSRPTAKAAPKPVSAARQRQLDDEKLKSAIEQIEEALRTYGDELKR